MWERKVFTLEDNDTLGRVLDRDNDETFDDVLAGRNSAEERTGTFVGNIVERRRFRLGTAMLGLALALFLGRVAMWQIVQGAEHRALADDNRTRTTVLPADRGVIQDRNGILLGWNEPSFRLLAAPDDLPVDEHERQAFLETAATLVDGDLTVYLAAISAASEDASVLLQEDLEYERALAFQAQVEKFPGLTLELGARRAYLTDGIPTLSHVLGYTGNISEKEYAEQRANGYRRFDNIGKQGVELEYEDMLRGTAGEEIVEVDSLGNALRTLSRRETVDGQDLTLTIDARLQSYVETVLEEKLKAIESKRASVIVTDAKTGEIRALVSYPAFDANLFTDGISTQDYAALRDDPNAPLFARAIDGNYPSGSTIKPMYSAAALIEGIVTPTTTFLSTGGVWAGTRFFPDWKPGGHGIVNVYSAIANSVNTFYYIIGGGTESFKGMGLDKLMEYAALFGFGGKTGVDLPHEASGFLPSKTWKEETKGEPWFIGDTYNVSIGQGDFLVSPMQMNRATAVFATGGEMWTPHLNVALPTERTRIIPEDISNIIRDAMHDTVVYGSARLLNTLPFSAAGKTGTAQWATNQPEHAWFTGFAPYEDPEIVITVIVESGGLGGISTPIAKDVMAWYFDHTENVDTQP